MKPRNAMTRELACRRLRGGARSREQGARADLSLLPAPCSLHPCYAIRGSGLRTAP